MQGTRDLTGGHGMSKRDSKQSKPVQQVSQASGPPAKSEEEQSRTIENYRHCPICWEGRGGYGVAYSTHGQTRYYKCCKTTKADQSPCGHTWTTIVKLEVIRVEHRRVDLEGQR
jgi:hypothetical protein